jgi:hypothetical protein
MAWFARMTGKGFQSRWAEDPESVAARRVTRFSEYPPAYRLFSSLMALTTALRREVCYYTGISL